ncbi:FHA domain-containing protein, partial [Mycobacterium sp.]|uniref:FHA domain-containing protein n=1 Tax=Mycobacterium sp. TaxID=1785 RepID=UPI002D404F2A
MSRPEPPALTVRSDGSQRTFGPGHDVVIGRDLRADVRVAHPLVSRAHVVLRYDHGRWVAIDNGSLNGMFVNNRRVPSLDIRDGQSINIGNPDGPQLTFEVGRHTGSVGRPPQTTSVRVQQRTSGAWSQPAPSRTQQQYPPSGTNLARPPIGSVAQPISQPSESQQSYPPPTQVRPAPGGKSEVSNLATSMIRILRPGAGAAPPPGSTTIGRATDNDIVIPDVLASRHHATLVPTPEGVKIEDAGSINGTFVNGSRVKEAMLHDGDVVTIGNVDLV